MQLPVRRKELICREVDNEWVILDRQNDHIHQLNETAGKIWDLCDGCHSLAQIAETLVSLYDIPYATAESDVRHTLDDFANLGLLQMADCA